MECKRKSIPRLEQLAEICDDKFELVEELLSVPLASYSTSNDLLAHIDRLKASCKDFSSCCHEVICATLRSGAIAEGQEMKGRKHQIKSAVKNKIDEASKTLLSQGLETVSNIDTNSTVYDRAESVVHDLSSLSIAPHEHVSNNTLNNAAQLSNNCNQSAIVHETAKPAVRFSAFESIAPIAGVSNMPKSSVSCVPVTTASKPIAAFNALHHPTLSTASAPVTSTISNSQFTPQFQPSHEQNLRNVAVCNLAPKLDNHNKLHSFEPKNTTVGSSSELSSFNTVNPTAPSCMNSVAANTSVYSNPQMSFEMSARTPQSSASYYVPPNTQFSQHVPLNTQFSQHVPLNTQFSQHVPLNTQFSQHVPPRSLSSSRIANPVCVVKDSASCHLIKQQLFQKASDPFSGDPMRFNSWLNALESKVLDVDLTPWDKLLILEANTIGEPQKIVRKYMAISGPDPAETLGRAMYEIRSEFGSSIQIANALNNRLDSFPQIRSVNEIGKLKDLLNICQYIEVNMRVTDELCVFNSAYGSRKVWLKLPESLQNSWRSISDDYRCNNFDRYPSFAIFVRFLNKKTRELSDPLLQNSVQFSTDRRQTRQKENLAFKTSQQDARVTDVSRSPNDCNNFKDSKPVVTTNEIPLCSLHENARHSLVECKKFNKMSFQEKSVVLKENKLCFLCFGKHFKANCTSSIKCNTCSGRHNTLMHFDKNKSPNVTKANESNLCTAVCGNPLSSKSCSKILLVDVSVNGVSNKKLRCYAIVDEQSSSTFADPKVAEFFNIQSPVSNYNLKTLSGSSTETRGILLKNLRIKGVGERKAYNLPVTYTNCFIPDCRIEVASPSTVLAHPHIRHLASKFNNFDKSAEVLLLLGRDSGPCMFTRCYGNKPPFAHHTSLGWALVGESCADNDLNKDVCVLRSSVHEHFIQTPAFHVQPKPYLHDIDIFKERKDDELPDLSKEDEMFLDKISFDICTNDKGNIVMPLPFRTNAPKFPNNCTQVYNRTKSTLSRLSHDEDKLNECIQVMSKYISLGHVEMVPSEEQKPIRPDHAWWIPVFPVTHPKKNKVRIVFDSSARYHGTSLNEKLLPGPDVMNRLNDVLLGFRNGSIGFSADIEAMFHNFYLKDDERDYIRFFWFADNDPAQSVCQFRAKVHIFGNCSSPAIAAHGLRHAAMMSDKKHVQQFVNDQFYVDDGLSSADSAQQAIDILKDTIEALRKYNIRLHKICSSSAEVMQFFPETELAPKASIDIEETSVQSALGLKWDVASDCIVIRSEIQDHPFTRRGLLATINSIFDPIGISAPILLAGKIIQRKLLALSSNENNSIDWDKELSGDCLQAWNDWRQSLKQLSGLSIPRSYRPQNFGPIENFELHAFCDASDEGFGHVMYLRSISTDGRYHVSFVCASSKIAPKSLPTTPRMELCAAVEVSLVAQRVADKLDIDSSNLYLYSDSKIVLGYLTNQEKRFSRYVTRRVRLVLNSFPASNWFHISTAENPADIASRSQTVASLVHSNWFNGPKFLSLGEYALREFQSVDLPETIEKLASFKVECFDDSEVTALIKRCSSLNKVVRSFRFVMYFVRKLHDCSRQRRGEFLAPRGFPSYDDALFELIRHEQQLHFQPILSINSNYSDALAQLSPFLDSNGILRVGGRLRLSNLEYAHKYPVILPNSSPLSILLISYYHNKCKHQGRSITLSAIRKAGFFIHRASAVIRSFISKCVNCRKLRLPLSEQRMSDLPADRLESVPPFTNSGVDIFGPYSVVDGATTRRSCSTKKCWAVIFTCLVSRATHIEPLPSLDTSSMINALRRFFCIRGPCKKLRSDQGTSFTGVINSETDVLSDIASEMQRNNCVWEMNPPKASHFGGIWERQIQSIKHILMSCFHQLGNRTLSRDDLYTFLQECANILNHTPLWEHSSDPNDPLPLTPAMLLTLRDSIPLSNDSFTERDLLSYGKKRWRRIQYLCDQFWSRWRTDYLQTLQKRIKWRHESRNYRAGDVVLLKDASAKRYLWPMAKVTSVKTSSDGLVRSVTLVTPSRNSGATRTLHRPICEISLLVPSSS